MDNIDELLANAEEIDYLADDIQFLIDENLRTVTIPPDGVVLGVEGDKNSNRVNFQMPRYYNGFDMSEFTVRVNYVNANGDGGVYTVNDLEVRDDMILFTWLVDSDACAYVGVVRFLVRMTITNGGELIQAFDTTIAKANVLEGLPITTIIDEEDRFDIILHLMSQVDDYVALKNSELDLSRGVGQSTAGMVFPNGQTGQNGAERFNDYDNNQAVGQYSHAEGYNTYAEGAFSHAEGWYTSAIGNCSHAEGYSTVAAGTHQHVIGRSNIEDTENKYAFIIGNGLNENLSNAFAIDWDGKIYVGDATEGVDVSNLSGGSGGVGQTTEGKTYTIDGYTYNGSSDCEIFNDYSGNKAAGGCSHAEGYQNAALQYYSHAEGYQVIASGYYSHAEGVGTKATANAAHAEGSNTTASNDYAHAEGGGTTASADWSHAEGKQTVASGDGSHAEGYATEASNYYSHAEGEETISSGVSSHSEGYGTKATGDYSHAEGYYTVASGSNAHAEGRSSKAESSQSHAEGEGTTASNTGAHAEGRNTVASGYGSHAEGQNTEASASGSHSEGGNTKATNSNSHAEGSYTLASGSNSHAEGTSTIAASANQHAQGKYNVEDASDKFAFIIGNGSSSARSNALAIDWDGKIYINNSETGIDLTDLLSRIETLEATVNGG